MAKDIIRKVHVNKKNKQLSVLLSKKELKKNNPDIKFGEQLFVKLSIVRGRPDGKRDN